MLRWLSHSSLSLAALVSLSVVNLRADELNLSRFENNVVVENLIQPMELDIAPDGTIFVIELAGLLKVIDARTGSVSVAGELNVFTEQENGLIGLALDPNFAENGWIYLQYSPPEFTGQHVSRFDFRDGKLDLGTEKLLLKYEEQRRECCHHAGSLEFGPDGNLFIGTGDNTNPFADSEGYAPLDQRTDRSPWDAQRTAGNTKNYNGKILRIHPEPDGTYSIPEGNLFPKDGLKGHPEIYVMGCRNPWRINVDQKTGYLYWGDVGPDAGSDGERGPRGYDEVNQARSAGNFGWPYFVGNNFAYAIVDFETGKIGPALEPGSPRNQSVNNSGWPELPPAQAAMIYYPSANSKEFPEVAAGGRTACAGPVYYFDKDSRSETKFPEAYDSTLFAFEWSRHWIMAVHLDHAGNVQRLERFMPNEQFKRPIDLQFDANGSLYVIEYGETWGKNTDSRLVRIDYVRGNRSPRAIAKISNNVGREPLHVRMSAAGSWDKDGDDLSYQWTAVHSIESSAQATNQNNPVPSVQRRVLGNTRDLSATFEEPGIYTIELKVTDPDGARGVSTMPLLVGNTRPTVEFLEPRTGGFFDPDKLIDYRVVVRDPEDGTSDFDEAEEEDGWEFIDSAAPGRVFVEAIPIDSAARTGERDSPGMALIRNSDCLNCHAINRPLVGPSFVAIADKYRNQPHEMEKSVERVLKGSTGVWGKIAMLPHNQHTPAEVMKMVQHVFSRTAASTNPNAKGFSNELETDDKVGMIRLEATYTDLGRDDIPKLSGVGSVTIRRRNQQAEWADEYGGTQPMNSDRAEGKQFMGAISHNGFLRFADINLDEVGAIRFRIASAGAGGTIEIRTGSKTGAVIGTTAIVVNGDWEAFYEKTVDLRNTTGVEDLFFVFLNKEHPGGLMNIDSVNFQRKGP